MKLTDSQVQEVKNFLEENLNQEIDFRLVHCMQHNEVIAKFFHFNLEPYIAPDTSDTVKNFIQSLKHKRKFKKFNFIPIYFAD